MKNRIVVSFMACFALSACASSGTKVAPQSLDQFQKGVSTERDVEKALGPPQHLMKSADGSVTSMYIWTHYSTKGATFIPVVGLFAGGAKGQSAVVTFRFDPAGKMIDYSTSQGNTDVRTGQ